MQCDQLQQHIDERLDRREALRSDGLLAAHLDDCAPCRRLASAYEAMLLGVELGGEVVPEGILVQQTVERTQTYALHQHGIAIGLAVAAALLIVVLSGRFFSTTPSADSPDSRSGVADSRRSASLFGDEMTVEVLGPACHSAGHQLAVLPQTVRRVATLPETDRIVGHIRPFTDPVGATWHVLLRVWPGTTTPISTIPDTDTSLILWQGAQYA